MSAPSEWQEEEEQQQHLGQRRARHCTWCSESAGSLVSTWAGETESEGNSSPASQQQSLLSGRVWLLSKDQQGCRLVQDALERAASDEEREAIAQELHGRVAKAMRDPSANHVLQKCISTLSVTSLQFMFDELLARQGLAAQAARHRYACRIVQQLLQRCGAIQTSGLVEAMLQDTLTLVCHPFGHHTIKQLLQCGSEDQRYRIVRTIEQNMGTIGRNSHGSNIIAAAMEYAALEDKVWMARAALQEPDLLVFLAQSRQGDDAVLRMLQALGTQERTRGCEELVEHAAVLGASKAGRFVAETLRISTSQVQQRGV